jgi:basic membrane lipoprotein Med (substrate-binding protein (PBP1-ABC) superfamily)
MELKTGCGAFCNVHEDSVQDLYEVIINIYLETIKDALGYQSQTNGYQSQTNGYQSQTNKKWMTEETWKKTERLQRSITENLENQIY